METHTHTHEKRKEREIICILLALLCTESLPLDGVQVTLLPLGCAAEMHKRSKYQKAFHVVYFGNSLVHYLTPDFTGVFADQCTVLIESALWVYNYMYTHWLTSLWVYNYMYTHSLTAQFTDVFAHQCTVPIESALWVYTLTDWLPSSLTSLLTIAPFR